MQTMPTAVATVAVLTLFAAAAPALGAVDDEATRVYLESPQEFAARHELSMRFTPELTAMASDDGPTPDVTKAPSLPPQGPKGPPLPLHTIEGTSGGAITGMAYFANPGPPGTNVSLPSASYTFLAAGTKYIHSVAISEVFFERIELSYAWNRVGLGSFPDDVQDALGVNIRDRIYLHNFNLRGILVPEDSFDMWMPQIVGGVHLKVGQGLHSIDRRAFGIPSALGFERETGIDYTLMAGKRWQDPVLKRPLLTNVGVRFTQAAQIGWLGFGNDWHANVEANIAWIPTDWLAMAYEYRQKQSPLSRAEPLVGKEEDWHTVLLAWLINDRATLAAVVGNLGKVVNTTEHWAYGIQFKYEF